MISSEPRCSSSSLSLASERPSHHLEAAPGGQAPSSSGAQTNTGINGERRSTAAATAGLSDRRRSCRNQTKDGEALMPVRSPRPARRRRIVVLAMMSRPPQDVLLAGTLGQGGHRELGAAVQFVAAVAEIAVISRRDSEHSDRVGCRRPLAQPREKGTQRTAKAPAWINTKRRTVPNRYFCRLPRIRMLPAPHRWVAVLPLQNSHVLPIVNILSWTIA